ncbi:hypothetical protein RJ639_015985 [Escallonia herrerae]|uniref:HAT C-terminal dimerisation domain-containing protein n=1 Tax=Escallonia herrerae TaxID=1293975 RepID=A0AA89ANS1_9ASTE|nr:hypothetical protein RJ639_015985 [Escallonia herrerae]
MWNMYRSCEKHSLDSSSAGSFSRIRRPTAPAFPVTALNSASTVVPLATTAYRIAIYPRCDFALTLSLFTGLIDRELSTIDEYQYPELAKIAQDILSLPISAMTFEAALSTRGRTRGGSITRRWRQTKNVQAVEVDDGSFGSSVAIMYLKRKRRVKGCHFKNLPSKSWGI